MMGERPKPVDDHKTKQATTENISDVQEIICQESFICTSVISEFINGLPSYNEENFSKFQVDNHAKTGYKRPPVYIATKDIPSEQVIVTERTNILLRYLHQQWDKKHLNKKRDLSESDEEDEATSNKKPRRENS